MRSSRQRATTPQGRTRTQTEEETVGSALKSQPKADKQTHRRRSERHKGQRRQRGHRWHEAVGGTRGKGGSAGAGGMRRVSAAARRMGRGIAPVAGP